MQAYNEAKIRWCSRVPETSAQAKEALAEEPEQWQELSDQRGLYVRLQRTLPQGEERWMMIRTTENLAAARTSLQKKASKEQAVWEKRLWHLGTQSFACQLDAEAAWKKATGKLPAWLRAQMMLESEPHYGKAGRASCRCRTRTHHLETGPLGAGGPAGIGTSGRSAGPFSHCHQ